MSIHMSMSMSIHMSVHMCVCTHVHTHVHTHAHTHVYACTLLKHMAKHRYSEQQAMDLRVLPIQAKYHVITEAAHEIFDGTLVWADDQV